MPNEGTPKPASVEQAIETIFANFRKTTRRPVSLMEVCGTHTMSIARSGLRSLLPDGLRLISGPGCPVCVTPTGYVDAAMKLAEKPGVILTTFGDMIRVPGTRGTLEKAKADGADVRIVYSPLKSLEIAAASPQKKVIFLGVGFETTAPATAVLVETAAKAGVKNLTVLSAHKLIPPALRGLVSDPELRVDGFILPGHVSVILGEEPYRFIAAEFKRPCVITGFEPQDVLESVAMLLAQIGSDVAEVQNQYRRIVRDEGNLTARQCIERVFEVADTTWRGFGVIPQSGLKIRKEFERWDAEAAFGVTIPAEEPATGCLCGEVLRGKIHPSECPLFAKTCTPATPVGPCMVSSEGACAASFRFEQKA